MTSNKGPERMPGKHKVGDYCLCVLESDARLPSGLSALSYAGARVGRAAPARQAPPDELCGSRVGFVVAARNARFIGAPESRVAQSRSGRE